MNIIFVVNFDLYKSRTDLKTVGGIEVNTNDVIEGLRDRNHKVWVPERNPREPDWVQSGEVDIIAAPTFDPLTYMKVRKYKNKFSERAAVVMHAHTTVEDLKGNFLPDTDLFNNILKTWLRILYGTAHLVITPSAYSKECLVNIQKSMTYPIHVVSNGIRIDKFQENKEYRKNFREFLDEKYGIGKNEKVVINVGLSWKKKGVDTFAKIAESLPQYYFVWVGPINKNPDIDEALKLNNVEFTGFYDDIREAYYGADLFLNTSYVENQGIPLIEAAICRLPIVARDLPAYDWLDHEISCLKAVQVSDFVSNIKKIIENSQFRKDITENAYQEAVNTHDFKKIGDKVEKLYKKAIKIKKIWDKKR